MATTTTKLGLTKPDYVDVVDVAELNTNADSIDAAVGFTVCTNATLPASPWTGQSIFETDTGSSFIWDGSAWQPGGGSGGGVTVSSTAPASPSEGDLWLDSDDGKLSVYYTDPGGGSSQWINAGQGSILQVVSTTKTDTFSASIATAAFTEITGLTASITPQSTSSKILAMVSVYGGNSLTSRQGCFALKLQRGATDIALGDTDGSRTSVTAHASIESSSASNATTVAFQFLDSPSTTAATTYSVEIGNVAGSSSTATFYVNRQDTTNDNNRIARPVSTITLMEVTG